MTYTPYQYEGRTRPGDFGQQRPLKVAVMSATKATAVGTQRESDSALLAIWSLFLPGVWSLDSTRSLSDTGVGRFSSSGLVYGAHHVPATELVTHGLLSELRNSTAFQVVHLDPKELADYDIVIRPLLSENLQEQSMHLYCLPFFLHMIPAVVLGTTVLERTYNTGLQLWLATGSGQQLGKVSASAKSTFSDGVYTMHEQANHLWEQRLGDIFKETLPQVVALIGQHGPNGPADVSRQRQETYDRTLISELVGKDSPQLTALLHERRLLVQLLEEESTLVAQLLHAAHVSDVNVAADKRVAEEAKRFQLAITGHVATLATVFTSATASVAANSSSYATEISIAKRLAKATIKTLSSLRKGLRVESLEPEIRPAAILSATSPELTVIYETYLADGRSTEQALASWEERALATVSE